MATFFAIDELNIEGFAIRMNNLLKNHTKIQLFANNYNLFVIIYNQFKMSSAVNYFQLDNQQNLDKFTPQKLLHVTWNHIT